MSGSKINLNALATAPKEHFVKRNSEEINNGAPSQTGVSHSGSLQGGFSTGANRSKHAKLPGQPIAAGSRPSVGNGISSLPQQQYLHSKPQPSTVRDPSINEDELWADDLDVPVNQWHFLMEDFNEKTPTRLLSKGKKTASEELFLRGKSIARISEFAHKLKLARRTVIAASVFLHRYYMFVPFNDFPQTTLNLPMNYKVVVAACVLLATKAEDNLVGINHITVNLKAMIGDEKEIVLKDALRITENHIIQILKFDFVVRMPNDEFEDTADDIAVCFNKYAPHNDPSISKTSNNNIHLLMTDGKFKWTRDMVIKKFGQFSELVIYSPVFLFFTSKEVAAASMLAILNFENLLRTTRSGNKDLFKETISHEIFEKILNVDVERIVQLMKYTQETLNDISRHFKLPANQEFLEFIKKSDIDKMMQIIK